MTNAFIFKNNQDQYSRPTHSYSRFKSNSVHIQEKFCSYSREILFIFKINIDVDDKYVEKINKKRHNFMTIPCFYDVSPLT